MSKRKIRKGRAAAVVAVAAAMPLVMSTSAWAGWSHSDTSAESYTDAYAEIYQDSEVDTEQDAEANTGYNEVFSGVFGWNETYQQAWADVFEGNIGGPFLLPLNGSVSANGEWGGWGCGCTDINETGNAGGSASNGSNSSNDGDANAAIATGRAQASNDASTDVNQANSGGANASSTNTVTAIDPDGGDTWAYSETYASLYVDQDSDVDTDQDAWANTGYNYAEAVVEGANETFQEASATVSGGNIWGGGEENYAGNTGGTATNDSTSSNLGTASATITTGDATATNNSTTNVTQNNSGGASATSNNDVYSED